LTFSTGLPFSAISIVSLGRKEVPVGLITTDDDDTVSCSLVVGCEKDLEGENPFTLLRVSKLAPLANMRNL
jgi:hypothetical protein